MLQRNNTRAGMETTFAEVQDSQANDMDEDRTCSGSLGITQSMTLQDKSVASNVAARRQTTWSANPVRADWAVANHRYCSFLSN